MALLGAASGAHCLGMCGGIVTAFALPKALVRKEELWKRQFAFNLGRVTTYAGAGALAGAAGATFLAFTGAQTVLNESQAFLYVLTNSVLVLAGLHLAGAGRWLAGFEALGAPLWRRVQPLAARLAAAPGIPAAYTAGLAWGALPCGLLYGALAASAFAGTPWGGAAAMLAFGAGTAPWLLAAGLAAARLRGMMERPALRAFAGGTVLAFGVWGLAHAGEAGGGLRGFIFF